VDIASLFKQHFYVQDLRHLSVLNIVSGVPFFRLKSCCVYVGGDDDVGEVLYSRLLVMVGKKEAILTFRRDKAPLSFRPTHD